MFLYNDYSSYIKKLFGCKVQKISLNAAFTCPNRDGSLGRGGCTYCNNRTFNPDYCDTGKSITQQLEEGKEFFRHKYPEMKYLAYFQAYTNTYGELDVLKRKYEEALAVDDVLGIVIGTRPDCMPNNLLDYLVELSKTSHVTVEYGIESVDNKMLEHINRGHTFEQACDAVCRTADAGLPVGVHMILGLPGDTQETILEQPAILSRLPITTLKLHQLQLIKGTVMAKEFEEHPERFSLFEVDTYIDTVAQYVARLRDDIVIERFVSQSPKSLLIAPDWGLKNYQFTDKLKKRMTDLSLYQGALYKV